MVTVHSLHLLFIGSFFLTASQIAPFQEPLLLFMLIIGIILVFLGIIFRRIKTVGMKIRKEIRKAKNISESDKQKFPVSKNYYLTYFLIFLAFIFTLWGLLTMPGTA